LIGVSRISTASRTDEPSIARGALTLGIESAPAGRGAGNALGFRGAGGVGSIIIAPGVGGIGGTGACAAVVK
jgi:hypothetical protein